MSDIILPHGQYEDLESYKNSVIIYDATQVFCQRYLKRGDRTNDQMVQAARSGKQNIVEGCMASGISSETEIKLVGVARASLEEVLEDYRDYLRTHSLTLWEKDDPRTLELRTIAKQKNRTCKSYKSYFEEGSAEQFCNAAISLIHQTNYLLDRQLKALQESFVERGGLRERMFKARLEGRKQASAFTKELDLLRQLYRELDDLLSEDKKAAVLQKITQVALLLKSLQ